MADIWQEAVDAYTEKYGECPHLIMYQDEDAEDMLRLINTALESGDKIPDIYDELEGEGSNIII